MKGIWKSSLLRLEINFRLSLEVDFMVDFLLISTDWWIEDHVDAASI